MIFLYIYIGIAVLYGIRDQYLRHGNNFWHPSKSGYSIGLLVVETVASMILMPWLIWKRR